MIEKERPDGIMLAFGGQTALNLGVQVRTLQRRPFSVKAVVKDRLGFGRTFSLSCFVSRADSETYTQMDRMGIFQRYGVKVLGTSIKTLETSEDRDLLYVKSTLVRSHEKRRLEVLRNGNG